MRGVQGVFVSGRALREMIDVLVVEGASLREIEREVIDPCTLGEDARDALWLYAWGSIERHRPVVPAA
jgi:hypothetical protein